ncbi:aldo/keto reductase [Zopfochytrium polystomum]|nr:aldo/keto reductase [Zopfochytrium polystomum]
MSTTTPMTVATATTPLAHCRGTCAIPTVGLGVYQASSQDCYAACLEALRRGYRHIDTAALYGNEADVGRAVRDSGVPREEVWITTKLWIDSAAGGGKTLRAFRDSARKISGDGRYDVERDVSKDETFRPVVDLYLIHAPAERTRMDAWREMELLYQRGHVRAIGVSNYGVKHLNELLSQCAVKPAVNQIELHPFFQRRDIVDVCHAHGVVVQAYSPLTRGRHLDHPTVVAVARRVGKSPAQVLVRWCVQKGFVPLPKTVKPQRLDENADVFGWAIPESDMVLLDNLEKGAGVAWDPTRWD